MLQHGPEEVNLPGLFRPRQSQSRAGKWARAWQALFTIGTILEHPTKGGGYASGGAPLLPPWPRGSRGQLHGAPAWALGKP